MSLNLSLPGSEPASEKQLDWLRKHKYYGKMNLSKSEANTLIDELVEQEKLEDRYKRDYMERIKYINGQGIE